MTRLPSCPHCRENGQVEHIKGHKYFCSCCGKTFTVKESK